MLTGWQARRWAAERLALVADSSPVWTQSARALEIDLLLSRALKLRREDMLVRLYEKLTAQERDTFRELVERRVLHEPIAYILGHRGFYGIELKVAPGVFIPRPETELLVDELLSWAEVRVSRGQKALQVVDMCTGTGAIVLAFLSEFRQRFGEEALLTVEAVGTDLSEFAIEIAKDNAATLGLDRYVSFVRADLLPENFKLKFKRENCYFVSNPPYIPVGEVVSDEVKLYEPELALRGGEDGLSVIRKIIGRLSVLNMQGNHETTGSLEALAETQSSAARIPCNLALECALDQTGAIQALMVGSGWIEVEIINDLEGRPRVVVARGK